MKHLSTISNKTKSLRSLPCGEVGGAPVMKKIIIYLSIVTAVFNLNSCYDLDTYPGDKLGESLFWQNEEHAKQIVLTSEKNANILFEELQFVTAMELHND